MSRSTWTYLIQHKYHLLSVLTTFIAYIQKNFHVVPKVVQTNNGSEFTSHACQTLFKKLGILHQRSIPYNAQQNDKVEGKH